MPTCLPASALLQAARHDAIHTAALPARNQTPDRAINELSITDQRVVISKDTDWDSLVASGSRALCGREFTRAWR